MKKEKAKKVMESLREDYNLVSSSFARTRDRLWPAGKFLFDFAKKEEKVLDLGCGNGRFSQYLEGCDYTGVDFSSGMVSEAKKRFPEKKFIVASALSLPFKDNFFDKIYSIAVIHQIPSTDYRKEALREAKRVLKKNGRIFITVWDLKKERRFFCLKQMMRNFFWGPMGSKDIILKRDRYYYLFSKKELKKIFEDVGFEVEEDGTIEEKKHNNFYLIAKKT